MLRPGSCGTTMLPAIINWYSPNHFRSSENLISRKYASGEQPWPLEWAHRKRDNSKWVEEQITNVTLYVTKLRCHAIVCGLKLPSYLKNKVGLIGLVRNHRGDVYKGNICSFRYQALFKGRQLNNFEKIAKKDFETYRAAHLGDMNIKDFEAVKLEDIYDLERLFKVNIFVYSLSPTSQDGNDNEVNEQVEEETPEITAQLIYRSMCHYPDTRYLNL